MKLQMILAEVFEIDSITLNDESKISDIESWDSMTHMILIEALESNYNIRLTGDQIAGVKTIGDIKNILKAEGVSF